MTPAITPKSYKTRLAIAARLRRARERANLSLRGAAQRAGITKARWIRYEQGLQSIPSEFLGELANAANTNVGKLLPKAA